MLCYVYLNLKNDYNVLDNSYIKIFDKISSYF